MERRQYMKKGLSPKPILMLLIFMPLFVHSLTLISIPCPNTIPVVPKISPRVDIGGFDSIPNPELESKRDIFIYWETIKLNETCGGDPFQYQAFYEVVTKNNEIKLIESNSTHKNHAEFFGLKTTVGYKFRVYSVNRYGRSEVYTELYVPHGTEVRFLNPLTLKKTLFNDNSGFELTWKYFGDYSDQLNNYTLFWCENDDEFYTPYQCNGDLNWIYLENSESRFSFTIPDKSKTYTFAISANGYSLYDIEKGIDQDVFMSGGMVWESCNYLDYMDMVLIQKIWISDIGVHRFGLRWKLDCTDNIGLVTDYIIFYCPFLFTENLKMCKGNMKTKFIGNNELIHKKIPFTYINSLVPNTSYVISIAAYTLSGNILSSIPIVATTLPRSNNAYILPTLYELQDYE